MKVIIVFLILGTLMSCSDSAVKTKNKEYLGAIAVNTTDIKLNREYLEFLFLEASNRKEVINFYELNQELFENDPLSNSIYGAALCSMGGEEKNIIEQLLLLKKGMGVLDRSVEVATDYSPYLWRIQTYSYFPKIMNVRSIVETDIETIKEQFTLPTGALTQVYSAQLNVAKEYKDVELLEAVVKSINDYLPIEIQNPLIEKSVVIRKEIGA